MQIEASHKLLLGKHLLAAGEHWQDAPFGQAATLVLICPALVTPCTLLTLRTDTLPLHAGQISFPGGRREAADASPEITALRESHEEIGLPPEHVEVLGRLPGFKVSSGIEITPVVGWCEALPALVPNPMEVASLIRLPLATALNPALYGRGQRLSGEVMRQYMYLEHEQHYVWGATASILHSLAELVNHIHCE